MGRADKMAVPSAVQSAAVEKTERVTEKRIVLAFYRLEKKRLARETWTGLRISGKLHLRISP